MLKKFVIGAAAVAAGMVPFAGVAAADPGYAPPTAPGFDQAGLLNLNNTDLLHNVNAVVGVCDNNINVLGVQVVVDKVLNGLNVPILSPSGENEAVGATPDNCASGSVTDGGTVQNDG